MDLKKYIYGHCVSPVKVKIWDAYSQSYVVREVPCGKCLHCRNTHINEWVTRLMAQRKYCKYCYYVSLDYAPFDLSYPAAEQLSRETAACKHDINKYKTFGLHPLVLCKNHLQDFYKRLRKNTNVKLQYFACGEYGMHADGHGFGRPHFHNLIFCNEPISNADFVDAWTIDNYVIGRVDFQDMSGYNMADSNLIKSFKYVSKYLQKADFDFEKLATIDFHRAYFKSLQYVLQGTDTLFPESVPITDEEQIKLAWSEYIKLYSPFVVCSRRPAIGSAYFADNVERFKEQDFRLFGLPKDCVTFPRYYLRRAKESLIDYKCLGSVTEKPSSSSRLGHILSVLSELYNARLDIETWSETSSRSWCLYRNKNDSNRLYIRTHLSSHGISTRDLSFYDSQNKYMYQFNGYNYNVWAKLKDSTFALIDVLDIYDVLHEVAPSWDRYHKEYLTPLEHHRVLREQDLINTVECLYKADTFEESWSMFEDEIMSHYQSELDTIYKTKLLMQNSKTTL